MDKRKNKDSNNLVEPIKISYRGADAVDEARFLHNELDQQPNLKISPPIEVPDRMARLGAAEIIITVVLTTIAKVTLEAVLDHLENYFQSRQEKSSRINVRIHIKPNDTKHGKHFPFRLTDAKPIFLKAVFGSIREFISKVGTN